MRNREIKIQELKKIAATYERMMMEAYYTGDDMEEACASRSLSQVQEEIKKLEGELKNEVC